MRPFLFTLIVGFTALLFASASYLIYLQHKNITAYTKQVLGVKKEYAQLKEDYIKIKNQNPKPDERATQKATAIHEAVTKIIDEYTAKTDGDLSIYYKNLNTDASIAVNPDKKYYMASLYKIILVLYLLDEVHNGTASLQDKVGTSSATLDLAIEKIITESNNEYAQTLAEEYGWKNIEKKMKPKLGIEFSFDSSLHTSVRSIGKLFEEIASALSVTDEDSRSLLTLMNNQKKLTKLPKYLPKHIYSHNKTGEFEAFSHDAGIFYTPKANYILIFMSKSKNPKAVDEQMALMSKEIYEALNQQM
ncbi:MAG: hypothetical protein RLZZ455_1107 [Candidatus Parcubacteria bacterium]|jgi:beta-lactamase class A